TGARGGQAAPRPGESGAASTLLADAGCAACFVHESLLGEVPDRFPGGAPSTGGLTLGSARGPSSGGRGLALEPPGPPPLLLITDDLVGRQGTADLGGALPFARLAASMPDHFDGEDADPQAEALLAAGRHGARSWTHAALAAAAADLAARLGLRDRDRLYSALGLDHAAGIVAGVALPAIVGTGVVLERDPDPETLPKRLSDERVTVALLDPELAAALSAGPGPDPRIRLVTDPFTDD
ncbi:MAG TPA: hypothetical protein VE776_15900, partial [Actinomycetota bacterium]|nr:hypothetical protein [Actinomycetota bacterium]